MQIYEDIYADKRFFSAGGFSLTMAQMLSLAWVRPSPLLSTTPQSQALSALAPVYCIQLMHYTSVPTSKALQGVAGCSETLTGLPIATVLGTDLEAT